MAGRYLQFLHLIMTSGTFFNLMSLGTFDRVTWLFLSYIPTLSDSRYISPLVLVRETRLLDAAAGNSHT